MKKTSIYTLSLILIILFLSSFLSAEYRGEVIDKIRITTGELPEGFIFGKVPSPYDRVIRDNPWLMDQAAIKKLAGRIYPGGDASSIKGIHITILADKKSPYGDDIVCYIIMYSNSSTAEKELKKLNEYVGFNNDRALVFSKANMAVYMHVDDLRNYKLMKSMAASIEGRLHGL